MFSFFKRKKKLEPEQQAPLKLTNDILSFNGCKLSLLISPDKNVKVVPDWPNFSTQEQALEICENFSKLIVNFFQEEMLQYILPAIRNEAVNRGHEILIPTMFGLMEALIKERKQKKPSDNPIISPREMFKVRG